MYSFYRLPGATVIVHTDGPMYATTDGVVIKFDGSAFKIDMDSMTVTLAPTEIDAIGNKKIDHSENATYDYKAILESLIQIFVDKEPVIISKAEVVHEAPVPDETNKEDGTKQ